MRYYLGDRYLTTLAHNLNCQMYDSVKDYTRLRLQQWI